MEQGNGKIWWWIAGIVVVVLIWVGMSGSSVSPVAGQTVKVGFIGPVSGDAGAYGQELQKIISYRVDELNRAAGSNGTKLEVIYEDGKCSGSDAVNAFQKLTNVDGVKLIIGGFCSSETLSMAPLANENHIVLLSAGSSNPKIEGIGPYVFSLSYSDKKIAEDLAKQMSSYKKIALITEQNDYNIGIRDTFVEAIKQYPGAAIAANETFPKGATDLRATLEKVKKVQPDAILLNPNGGTTAQSLIRQLSEVKNWSGYKLYGQFSYLSDSIRASAGSFTEGMIIIDAPALTSPKLVTEKDAIVKVKGTLDTLGSYYTASTLDTLDLFSELINKLGNDPVKVQKELSTGSFSGFIGDISFDGHNFVRSNLVGKYVVQGGIAVLQK